jgi:hypothetical protein
MVKLNKENEQVASLLNSIWKVVTYFLDTTLDVNMKEIENSITSIKEEYHLK